MTTAVVDVEVYDVEELSEADGRAMFSSQVEDRLGISAATFLSNYDAGAYAGTEDTQILRLIMMVPFAR